MPFLLYVDIMKIKVKVEFHDKFHMEHVFKAGEVVEFDDQRAGDIISRGLGEEYVEETKEETPMAPKAPRKPRKKVEDDQ